MLKIDIIFKVKRSDVLKNADLCLASLLSSKLCHDLLAPVSGAIFANSMLEDSKFNSQEVLGIITSSIETLSKKLQLFRVAFSFSKGEATPIIKEVKETALVAFTNEKQAIEWQDAPFYNLETEGHWGRLILNLGMIAHESLLKGGILKFDLSNIPQKISILAEGPLIVLNGELELSLKDANSTPTVRSLPGNFAKHLIDLLGLKLEIHHQPKKLEFVLSL